MSKELYNMAHPMEAGKSIFLPFGEWDYDGSCRQRLDRAHGEAIANELNARVERGEPGIPVYQGHPDVPQLASRYPDKGALGWVTKIELVNEGGKDGLRLSVEWDRDPGKGFRWFSPYWIANSSDGGCHIVSEIASIGLVNNPNIREFRLANELQSSSAGFAMPQHLIDLARRFDERVRLANEANYDESKHPRAEDGKWTSGGGGGEKVITITGDEDWMGEMPKIEQTPENRARGEAAQMLRKTKAYQSASAADKDRMLDTETKRTLRKNLYTSLEKKVGSGMAVELFRTTGLSELDIHGDPSKVERAAHRAAILSGLKYDHSTRSYK